MELINSLSMWTRPNTPEQMDAYSLHADERTAYNIGSLVLQSFWALTDLPAIAAILYSVSSFFPAFLFWVLPTAFMVVFTLHFILKSTLKVSLHKMLKEATWIDGEARKLNWLRFARVPILISCVLYSLSVSGLFLFEKQNGYKANVTAMNTDALEKEIATHERSFSSIEKSIVQKYKSKENAALLSITRKIENLEAKKPINDWHKNVIKNDLAELKAKRNAIKQQLATAKINEVDSLLRKKTATIEAANNRYNSFASVITENNDSEMQKQRMSAAFGSRFSWAISLVCLLLFFGAQRKLSEINFKCGIFPKKEFTAKDASGSWLEELIDVIGDIAYRRGKQLNTWIHRIGTWRAGNIQNPDGSMHLTDATYHQNNLQQQAQQTVSVSQQAQNTVITPVTMQQQTETIIQQVQNKDAEAMALINIIRSDISNLKNGNGNTASITARLDNKFEILAILAGRKEVSERVILTIGEKFEQYQKTLREKEVPNV